jgi:hypothetical protein
MKNDGGTAPMASKRYLLLTTTLIGLLAGLAAWQFYFLVWGDPLRDLASIGVLTSR